MPIPIRRRAIKFINEYYEAQAAARDAENGVLTAGHSTPEQINQLKKQYEEVRQPQKEAGKAKKQVFHAPVRRTPG